MIKNGSLILFFSNLMKLIIIPNILVPIEVFALKDVVSGSVREIRQPHITLMIELYNDMGNDKYELSKKT